MRKSKLVRFIAVVLCMAVLVPSGVFASTIDEIKDQREQLKEKQEAAQAALNELRDDEDRAQEYGAALVDKIDITEQKIDSARESIDKLNKSIKVLQDKLEESAKEYDSTLETLKVRINALYQTGDVGTVEILLNATSLYDFSLKTEALKSISKHDKDVMEEIRKYMDETKTDRDALAEQKVEVAKLKVELENDQEELEGLYKQNSDHIASLQNQQSAKSTELSNLEEEDETLNAELQRLIEQKRKEEEEQRRREEEERKRQEEEAAKNQGSSGGSSDNGSSDNGSSGGSSGGSTGGSTGGDGEGMSSGFDPAWPLPGYDTSWVTCWYGDGGHNGFDIAGNYGAQIIASQAGQVLSAEYHYSWGNNVLLYHNGTYQTRYAHMSSMAVSSGEYVQRGQVIGYVGSTGNSTGNHLHYEVYYNGTRVDPYPYLS